MKFYKLISIKLNEIFKNQSLINTLSIKRINIAFKCKFKFIVICL